MSDALRAFFAIDLPAEARATAAEAIAALQPATPEDARWVTPERLHLTLKFLGEIREDDVPRLIARAQAKLASEVPFELALAGFGAFPNAREATVLWLGVAQGAGPLAKLARKLDSASRALGGARDRRPFAAHLTLARLRTPARVELERVSAPDSVPWTAAEVILYESRPSAGGTRYVPLARLPLGAGGDAESDEFAPEI
jgi:2'-5' RNA ligase